MDRFISDQVDWALDLLDHTDPDLQPHLHHYLERFLARVEPDTPEPDSPRALIIRYWQLTQAAMMAGDHDTMRSFGRALRARMQQEGDR